MGFKSSALLLRDEEWRSIEAANATRGVVLVRVAMAGKLFYLAEDDVEVESTGGGDLLHFVGGILDALSVTDSVDFRNGISQERRLKFRVDIEHLPLDEVRENRIVLQDCDVDVWWTVVGPGLNIPLDHTEHVLSGKMHDPVIDEEVGVVSFSVEDVRLEGDRPFPPELMSTSRIATLDEEATGKPYPIVIGEVTKLPVSIYGASDDYLAVAHDPNREYAAAAVTAVYEGDATGPPTISSQGLDTDNDGVPFWYVALAAEMSSKDVTVDLGGVELTNPVDVVFHLLNNYSSHGESVDVGSLTSMRSLFSGIEMGVAFNERVEGGVLPVIQTRICKQVPIFMFNQGGMLTFKHRLWDRDVVRYLETDRDLVRKTAPPREVPRNEVYNDFSFNYAVSGLRGDFTGVVVRTKDNDFDCKQSAAWYGQRSMQPVELPDIRNERGVNLVADWYVQTHSVGRVFVSYSARVGSALALSVWDTVRVYDEWEGWTHAPLFKVLGKRRSSDDTIDVSLVSIDDCREVYTPDS